MESLNMEPFHATVADAGRDLHALREALCAWLVAGRVPEPVRGDVVLATHEAVANALEHGASPFPARVHASREGDAVVVEVSDHGHWKDVRSPPSDDRGRGLELIRWLVGRLEVDARSDGTTVWMRTDVPDAEAAVPLFG